MQIFDCIILHKRGSGSIIFLAKNIKQGNMGEAYVTDKLIYWALKKKTKLDDILKSLSHFT